MSGIDTSTALDAAVNGGARCGQGGCVPRRLGWLLALLATGVFWAAVRNEFLYWDDDVNIYNNPHIQRLDGPGWWWMFTNFDYARRYLPLGWLGWAVQYQWFGLTAWTYHLGNLLFHVANTLLVFRLLERLLSHLQAGVKAGERTRVWAAFFGALLWSIHPLRVEVVAWASARIYSQAAFFLFLSWLAYLEYAQRRMAGRRAGGWYAAALGAYGASLLTYPIGLMAWPVFLVVDIYPLRRLKWAEEGWRSCVRREWWMEKLPFVGASVGVGVLTVLARSQSGVYLPMASWEEFGLGARVMQAAYVTAYYVWRPWWPMDLSPIYSTLVSFKPWAGPFVLSLAMVVGLSVWLARRWRQYPGVCLLWVVYLGLVLPFVGFTEHPHFAGDRYSYVVAVGWSLLLAAGWCDWMRDDRWQIVPFGLPAAVAGFLALLSLAQTQSWQNSVVLHHHMLAKLGNHSYRAKLLLPLGVLYREQKDLEAASICLKEVLRVEPGNGEAHANLGDVLMDQGRPEAAREHYQAVLRVNPAHLSARQNLAISLAVQGRLEEAVVQFEELLRFHPNQARAHHNLSLALAQLGRVEEAERHRRQAEQLRTVSQRQPPPE